MDRDALDINLVREAYVAYCGPEGHDEFDRWLAEHDQEVASAAIAVAESGIGMADGKHDCDHVIHVSPEQFAQIIGEEA